MAEKCLAFTGAGPAIVGAMRTVYEWYFEMVYTENSEARMDNFRVVWTHSIDHLSAQDSDAILARTATAAHTCADNSTMSVRTDAVKQEGVDRVFKGVAGRVETDLWWI